MISVVQFIEKFQASMKQESQDHIAPSFLNSRNSKSIRSILKLLFQ